MKTKSPNEKNREYLGSLLILAYKGLLQLCILQGVCLALVILRYALKSVFLAQIQQNLAYLTENTLKFYILSKN